MTPTQLSLRLLRKANCLVAITEHWNHFAKIRQDMFGFGDLLYLSPAGETGLVQTTTYKNVSARRKKIRGNPNAAIWLDRGNRIVLDVCARFSRRCADNRAPLRTISRLPIPPARDVVPVFPRNVYDGDCNRPFFSNGGSSSTQDRPGNQRRRHGSVLCAVGYRDGFHIHQ